MNPFTLHWQNKELIERVRLLEDELMVERARVIGLEAVIHIKDLALTDSLRSVTQLKTIILGMRE